MSLDIDTPLTGKAPEKEDKPLWPIEIPADQCADPEEKRILFGNGDRLGLFPLKHQWAWEAYNDMQANHWRPNEIPMGPDIACWKAPHTLMPEERRVFWLTFGRLTTMDLLRVDSIAMLSQITTSPEVAMALDWMNAQERLHCYAEGTDILTDRGWVPFEELEDDDLAAQWDEGGIQFVEHSGLIKHRYEGKMVRFENQASVSMVTPNHKCTTISLHDGKLHKDRADEVRLSNRLMPVAGTTSGPKTALSAFDKLNIAFQADGRFLPRKDTGRRKSKRNSYYFNLKKERKISRLTGLLRDLGIEFSQNVYSGATRIHFSLEKKSKLSKEFEWVDLDQISASWAREFVEETMLWDGGTTATGVKLYRNTNEQAVDMAMAVACLCGIHARKNEYEGVFHLTYVDKPYVRCYTLRKTEPDYDGYVYCTTVPSHNLVVRYAGRTLVSGNSESYETCIDGLGFDYGQIYNLYHYTPSIKAQVDLSRKIDYDFLSIIRDPAPMKRDYLYEEAIKTSAFWFLMFEGIWFVANLSGAVQNLARQGKMTATAEQFLFIRRDEDRHIKLGVDLIRSLIGECPAAWNDKTKSSIRQTMLQCLSLEQDFIEEALPRPIMGYSAEGHMQYVQSLANMRCRVLGLEEVAKGATNPYPWISSLMEMKKEKNFFEKRIADYQVGQLKWD